MRARPPVANKVVYAIVEPVENRERFVVEHGLTDVGWPFERDGELYIVALPLYCHRSVALAEARTELADFSRSYARLSIRELRLGEAELPPTRLARVSKKHRSGFLKRFNNDPEVSIGREPWEFYILRSTGHASFTTSRDAKRAAREEANFTRAVATLTAHASRLPGTPFDPSSQKVTTASAPAIVVTNPRKQRAMTIGWGIILPLVILAIVTCSTLMWSQILHTSKPLISLRGVGVLGWGAASIGGCTWFGLRFTADRRNRVVRSFAVGTAIILGLYVGLALNYAQLSVAKLAITVVVLAVGILLYFGLTHLFVRMPTSRTVMSLSGATLLAALGSSTSPLLLSRVFEGMGLPLTAQQAPDGVRLIMSAVLFCILTLIAAFLGALVGWLKYFSVSNSISVTQAINVVVAGLVLLATFMTTAIGLSSFAHERGQTWRGDLVAGSVPGPLPIFMSRACLTQSSEGHALMAPAVPVIVINTSDGSTLLWDLSPDERADANQPNSGSNVATTLELYDREQHSLRPLADSETTCDQ